MNTTYVVVAVAVLVAVLAVAYLAQKPAVPGAGAIQGDSNAVEEPAEESAPPDVEQEIGADVLPLEGLNIEVNDVVMELPEEI